MSSVILVRYLSPLVLKHVPALVHLQQLSDASGQQEMTYRSAHVEWLLGERGKEGPS